MTASHMVVASLMEPLGWPTVNTMASILLSQSALACSADFSSVASAKSSRVQPSAFITTSMVPRWPEPGLPTFTRLPLSCWNRVTPESARATTVKGSG